ncbi:MAG TPA: oxidoreductase, partial [Gammaproteobacteria bacterium]|nr:oxidoreductase [Gammaproteobacteria bacterium]
MSAKTTYKWIGSSPVRPDGVDKVTGRANFGADHSEPGMIYGKVLRSPIAHGRIQSIDLAPALQIPGVLAAMCGDDFPDADAIQGMSSGESPADMRDIARNVMARDKVLYHGH